MARRVPTPMDVVSWGAALFDEISRLPTTLSRARRLVGELPDQIDQLIAALDRTVASVEELHHMLPELSGVVGGMDERLERLGSTVNDLGDSVVGAIGAIPGLRRAARPRPPA